MPKPFVKNDSRINRKGRPLKAYCLSKGLRDFMFTKDPITKKEIRDLFIEKAYNLAFKGDIAAMRLILMYTEGSPRQMVEMPYEKEEEEEIGQEVLNEIMVEIDAGIQKRNEQKISEITEIISEHCTPNNISIDSLRGRVESIIKTE